MLRKILIILFVTIVLIAIGVYWYMQSHIRLRPEAPPITTFTGYTENEISTLTFPVSIDLQDVQDKLNDKLENKPIHAHIPVDDGAGTLDLDMIFYDEIKLSWQSQQMIAIVPLEISASIETKRLGVRIHNENPITAKVNATMSVDPDLVAGWELKCVAVLEDVEWIRKPMLEIGKFKIDLTTQVEKQIEQHQENIEKAVEKKINKALRIHDVIEKLWSDIQKPIIVNKKGLPLYLRIKGTDLSAKWQNTYSENPAMLVCVEGYYELTAGGNDFSDTTRTPLPDFKKCTQNDPGIFAHINANIGYPYIIDFIQPKLDSLKLQYAEYKIKIKDFEIYGGDSVIYFSVGMRGDINGTVYLKGKPGFDDFGRTIKIDDFNYDIYSESALASTADEWMHDILLAKANEYLTFELDSLLQKLPDAMMNGIERSKVGNKIDVAVDELFVKPLNIRSATDHLALQMLVQGNATLRLEKDVFKKKKKEGEPQS